MKNRTNILFHAFNKISLDHLKMINGLKQCPPPPVTGRIRVSAFTLIKNGIISRFIHTNSRKTAFTLAEVLITLGIIGIVAGLTVPLLTAKYQEKVTVTKLKKTYSVLSNAFLHAKSENGDIYTLLEDLETGTYSAEGAKLTADYIKPYLKVTDECSGECKNYTDKFIHLNLTSNDTTDFENHIFTKIYTADGTALYIRTIGCNKLSPVCGDIFVDINGKKEPNTLGRDIFNFQIKENSTISTDGIGEDPSYKNGWQYCNPDSQGWYCTAWVLYKENMDYLKCADKLTWDGKDKCR